jgi:hypothetical protein
VLVARCWCLCLTVPAGHRCSTWYLVCWCAVRGLFLPAFAILSPCAIARPAPHARPMADGLGRWPRQNRTQR